jgi:hypothetical protein
MEPFNPISSTPPTPPDNDSAAAEDAKSQQRRDDRAQAFKQVMSKGATPATPGTPTPAPAHGKKVFTTATGQRRMLAADETAMNPALMRLRAEGYPLSETSAKQPTVKPAFEEEHADLDQSQGQVKRDVPRQPETQTVDPVKQAAQASSNSGRGERGGGAEKETTKSKQDGTAPDPRLLAGPVLLPTPQNFQAAVERATSRPAPPPELLQQLVEFAAVHRNADGLMEFRLGLVREALGGLQIQMQAYGNRRIGLKIKSGGKGGIGEEEVAGLIDALRAKNVEVVDVVLA